MSPARYGARRLATLAAQGTLLERNVPWRTLQVD